MAVASRSSCHRGKARLVGAGASVKMQSLQRCHLKQKGREETLWLLSCSSSSDLVEHTRNQSGQGTWQTYFSPKQSQARGGWGLHLRAERQITVTCFVCLCFFEFISAWNGTMKPMALYVGYIRSKKNGEGHS